MSNDLVKRLRALPLVREHLNTAHESADRIEALETEHEKTRPLVVAMHKYIGTLEAALREIDSLLPAVQFEYTMGSKVRDIARRALEGKR